MAEVQLKQDIESYARRLQRFFEVFGRFLLRIIPPQIKAMANTFYKEHMEGIKAVQTDGSTKEIERVSNLSYEEVVETMAKCQKDDVKVIAYEFKNGYKTNEDGNYIVDEDFGKNKSVSKMKEITKANRKIQSYEKYQSKHPKLFKNYTTRKLNKWNGIYEKAINKHEGVRYNLVFNKRHMGYMADRISDIKSTRLGITKEEFYTKHPEAKEAVERAIDSGLELNTEELGEWAKEFVNEGDTDISNFKDDYLIHTVSMAEYSKIYKDLDNNVISYGVELNKNDDSKKDIVKVYINSEDLNKYQKAGHLDKGVLQSFGKKDNNTKIYNLTRKEEKESKDIILPRTSMEHYIDMFKGRDFTMNLNGKDQKTFIVRMTLNDAKEVLAYQKKRNRIQEKLDEIHHEKELAALENKINEIEKAENQKSGDEINYKNAINKENIDKVPTSVNYDTLSTEVKNNLKETYGFNNDEEAKTYFDNCQLELGTNRYDNKMGVLVTETTDKEQKQFFIYNDEPNKRNVTSAIKSNDNKETIDNNTDVSDTVEDKDIDMEIEMNEE